MASESTFTSDIDFCKDCGAILPLPGVEDFVKCAVCNFSINVREFHNHTTKYTITFNEWKKLKNKNKKQDNVPSGPMVDRKCSNCGHEGMSYSTLQTRSADEGQTVFYTCPKCQHGEHENS